jgi:hypothetical protein
MTWRELAEELAKVPTTQLDKPVFVAQADGEVTMGVLSRALVDCKIGAYRAEQMVEGEFFLECYTKPVVR